MKGKPIASLSFDLDNQWSYMKTHGDSGWESFPSYLDLVVPRVLEFLRERDLTITFFIVGQDAALEKNREAIQSITAAGHEIGNHSFNHEPWLELYTEHEIETDLARAEEHIMQATGRKPIGFRGPGYSLSRTALEALIRRGYLYDASTLPTFIGPLARAYYFMSARLTREEREQRSRLFGAVRDGLRPNRPYWLKPGGEDSEERLLEIPVTTMPWFRIPFHTSYVLYLSTHSPGLARMYVKSALLLCRLTGVQPSHLLHPLDFLGRGNNNQLPFFPAMNLPAERKMRLVGEIIDLLTSQFRVVPLREHAQVVLRQSDLRTVQARFERTPFPTAQKPAP